MIDTEYVRCICHGIDLTEAVKVYYDRQYTSIDELQDARICSTCCKLCVPYLEMLIFNHK